MIGRTIDDRYTVEAELGSGGFGIVYRCLDHMGRHVALKMLKTGVKDERTIKRFMTEGRKLAAVGHPNVVQVYDSGEWEEHPYIVMEELQGRSLSSLIRSRELLPRDGARVLADVACGLRAIHESGLIHRDLSTNNVMVDDGGAAKILDLGLARGTGTHFTVSTDNAIAGTPAYMSPEQLENRDITTASDLFSLGIMLYEVLSGSYPFSGEHPKAILYGIVHRDARPLHTRMQGCPPGLEALVHACMEKRPEDRPRDLRVIERTLREFMQSDILTSISPDTTVPIISPPVSHTPSNPYLNRVMIRRRGDFFGRRRELQRIYSRLNATPPGSISVVGERKIGKSSLLNHVYLPQTRQESIEYPDRMVMVFLDFQQEHNMSLETFVKTLLGMAQLELRDRIDISDCAHSLDGVKEFVERLDSAGFRLVILMDEFEAITRNPSFQLEFFSFLRYLANHYNVAYLTSSARELQILCHTQEIADSPFFNIFSSMRLGILRHEEAVELISAPSERVSRPLAEYVDLLIEMAGLFPLFLQIACAHTIEFLEANPEEKTPDFPRIRQAFVEEASQHLNYIWDLFDEHERKACMKLASHKKVPASLQHVIAELKRKSYVVDENGHAALFSSTFEGFVREHESRDRPSFFKRLFGGSSSTG